MKYYIYFDGYGISGKVISEVELAEKYNNNPDEFHRMMSNDCNIKDNKKLTGSVSVLNFESEKELIEYLESLGDEITGFYGCEAESRPYNF
ncbi:MAG TPA: hypothetical protein PK874_05325 [Desulfobacteraceae bacterium]|nr:hypothetical protein [Desulfobacteraceae bacterium]HPJ66924.1 hypothetical protein [Desulfobacteraceae bacterium]HPQ27594.1 hypothetical protein [Desulfobacteraceae bacterium]